MNPESEPTIVDDFEEAGLRTAAAVRKVLDRIPFVDKGFFPVIFFPVLLVAMYYQSTALWGAASSDIAVYTWKPVNATVLESGATGERFAAMGARGSFTTRTAILNLDTVYRYEFDGRSYKSSSFGLDNSPTSSHDPGLRPADWMRDHPVGSHIVVLVNPHDPEMSAIDPSPTFMQALVMLVAMPFTLLGLTGVLTERSQSKLHYERIVGGWGAVTLIVFAIGHALTVATSVAIAVYFAAWFVIYRHAHKKWVSDIEENVDAPPMDIRDFGP